MADFITALAPLAGFTDRAFREICKMQGVGRMTSEMVSSRGLYYGDKKTAKLLSFGQGEQPLYIQLFGCEPDVMAYAAKKIEELNPAGIDINMGCPMPKIVNNGDGCALMRDTVKAESVIRAVVNAVKIPVSVKFRSGYDEEHINAPEFAAMCESAGAECVTVHGRTKAQLYSGNADWNVIARVKRSVGIPVIGNGDVFCPEDAKRMYEQTGVDGIAVGRGAQGNPFIFRQIADYIATGRYETYSKELRIKTALEQVRRMCEYKGESHAVPEARKHLAFYLKGMHGAAKVKNEVFKLTRYKDIEELLTAFIACR